MAQFSLWLTKSACLSLEKTSFTSSAIGSQLNAVRGKTAGAYKGFSTFQWTPAVQSMVMLTLRAAARALEPSCPIAMLHGYDGSPASSLDYSIGKTPVWMLDIFGVDRAGTAIAKRLFKRTNPERKRSGPVAVSLNENMLPAGEIAIFLNETLVSDHAVLLQLADEIEDLFLSNRKNTKLEDSKPINNYSRSNSSSGGKLSAKPVTTSKSSGKIKASSICCPCCGETLTIKALQPIAA